VRTASCFARLGPTRQDPYSGSLDTQGAGFDTTVQALDLETVLTRALQPRLQLLALGRASEAEVLGPGRVYLPDMVDQVLSARQEFIQSIGDHGGRYNATITDFSSCARKFSVHGPP
jgi:hypothetical protein